MKKLPYWLKGGIITLIIFLVLALITLLLGSYLDNSCAKYPGCIASNLSFILLTIPGWAPLSLLFGRLFRSFTLQSPLLTRGREKTAMQRDYPLERVRNFGIIAHIDAGKTTTSERILYYTGESVTRSVKCTKATPPPTGWNKNESEVSRLPPLLLPVSGTQPIWERDKDSKKHRFNIIDTPGHIDFTAEVKRSLRVLDGAVVVFDGVAGVEPQSETNWRYADDGNVPRICFINKLDRTGASFERSFNLFSTV
jgi:hypothetical protein